MVGVGASAGGLSAFQAFLSHVPADAGIAWVLIQHMAPDRHSNLASILSRHTALPVVEVTDDTPVEPNCVYVIAPGRTMTIRDGVLVPVTEQDAPARRTSIDAFFLSLAANQGERTGCALLSGAGSDGTIGLKAVKEAGGLTMAQTVESAEYDSMLVSAIQTGLVDRELAVEEMGEAFVDFLVRRLPVPEKEAIKDGDRLRACRMLLRVTGHDFSGYKHSTVDRRIKRRMQMVGATDLSEYLRRLEQDKPEAERLTRDLLIGVTQFFRDPEAFDAVSRTVVAEVLKGRSEDDEVRIWVPGCATGEEVYSLAMLFQEQVASLDNMPRLKFFGSDIDDNALQVARIGRYPQCLSENILNRMNHL